MNYTNLNSNINIYFGEIRKFEPLTKEDERVLFGRIAKGDPKAQDEIFNRMAKMAVAVAKKYTGRPELLEDLIQEANIGILTAIPKFDLSVGYRFSSYAKWWMEVMISRHLEIRDTMRSKDTSLGRKVKKIRRDFYNTYGREACECEVLDELEKMGVVVTDFSKIEELCMESISSVNDDDEEFDRSDYNTATCVENDIEKDIEEESIRNTIMKRMKVLDQREKEFVLMNYGIGYDYPMDYDTIASRENSKGLTNKDGSPKTITSERVRQIVTGAIKKMQK